MRFRPLLFSLVLLGAAVATGCASPPPTQVTRFHRLQPGPKPLAGQSFRIVSAIEGQDSLEYSTYRDQLKAALTAEGLIEAGSAGADLSVTMAYESSPDPIASGPRSSAGVSVGTGVRLGTGVSIGVGVPLGLFSGLADGPRYRRTLRVWIDQTSVISNTSDASARLFEATAIIESSAEAPSSAFAALVRAMFLNFPGENGQTRVLQDP